MKNTVVCRVCGKELGMLNASHLSLHHLTMKEYRARFIDAEVVSEAQAQRHGDYLVKVHAEGNWLSDEGRKAISDKLKKRHAETHFTSGENHWHYDRLKVRDRFVSSEECKNELERYSVADMTTAEMADAMGVGRRVITKRLKFFGLQRGIRAGARCSWYRGGHKKSRGEGWGTIRKHILERDCYKCTECDIIEPEARKLGQVLGVHHVIPYEISHDNSDSNLQTLCSSCHLKREWKDGRLSQQYQS